MYNIQYTVSHNRCVENNLMQVYSVSVLGGNMMLSATYTISQLSESYSQAKHSHYTVHGLVLPSNGAATYMSAKLERNKQV